MKETCKRVERLLHYFLEGSLSEQEKAFIETHLQECPDCASSDTDLSDLNIQVEPLPEFRCPEGVEIRVFSEIRFMKEEHAVKDRWHMLFGWKGALAGAAAAALIFLMIHMPRHTTPSTQNQYSEEELEQARAVLKWSLAFSAQTVQKNEDSAINQVFGNYIPKSVQTSARKLLPLFNGGEK